MASAGATGQRWVAVLVLLVLGVLSLPVTAAFFGEDDNENWILPVAVLLMLVLGAIVGSILPGLAGSGAGQPRRAFVGAAVGVGMLVLGVVVFFLLLSGFDGA